MGDAPQPKSQRKLPRCDGTQRHGYSNYRCKALAYADALNPAGVLRSWVDQVANRDGDLAQENLPAQNRGADKKLLGEVVQPLCQEPLELAEEGEQSSKAVIERLDGKHLSQRLGQGILAVKELLRQSKGEKPIDRYFGNKRRLFREDLNSSSLRMGLSFC
jgi:hypothetical protein